MKILIAFLIILLSGCKISGTENCDRCFTHTYSQEEQESYFCEEYYYDTKSKKNICTKSIQPKETIKRLIGEIQKTNQEIKAIQEFQKIKCEWKRNFDLSYWPTDDCPKTYVCEKIK